MKNNEMTYEEKYNLMKAGLEDISKSEHDSLVLKCQENGWLKIGGYDFEEDPFLEEDSPYSFVRAKDVETMKLFFDHANWSIRNGILYKDLAFINQINGGSEYWTLKYDYENSKWVSVDSISMKRVVQDNEFEELIERLLKATIEQCSRFDY